MRSAIMLAWALVAAFSVPLPMTTQAAWARPARQTQPVVSIANYRLLANNLQDQNEQLSNELVATKKVNGKLQRRLNDADAKWQKAEAELAAARRDNRTSRARIKELEQEASDREAEFAAVIDEMNAQLVAQDADFARQLRAATDVGTEMWDSAEGREALRLIALGGEENNEAALAIVRKRKDDAMRADKLRMADRARELAIFEKGLRGKAPSATTARLISLYEEVVLYDPDFCWDWIELSRLYRETGDLANAQYAAKQALNLADNDYDRLVAHMEIGDNAMAMRDLALAQSSYEQAIALAEGLGDGSQQSFTVSMPGHAKDDRNDTKGGHPQEEPVGEIIPASDPMKVILTFDNRVLLAALYTRLGDILVVRGDIAGGSRRYQQAMDITNALLVDPRYAANRPNWLFQLAIDYSQQADILVRQGQKKRARGHYEEAIAILNELNAQSPDDWDTLMALANLHGDLGNLIISQANYPRGISHLEKAVAFAKHLVQLDPSSTKAKDTLWREQMYLGDAYSNINQSERARPYYEDGLTLATDIMRIDPESPDALRRTTVSLQRLGDVYMAQGDWDAAMGYYQQSLAIDEKLAAAYPDHANLKRNLVVSLINIGDVKAARGDRAGAQADYLRAFAINEALATLDATAVQPKLDEAGLLWKLAEVGADGFTWARVVTAWENLDKQGQLIPADRLRINEVRANAKKEREAAANPPDAADPTPSAQAEVEVTAP